MKTPRVLIVDDSLTVRMDLAQAFEAAGFDTVACGTAQAAREALAGGGADLLVLDVLLPDADGIDFLKELREGPVAAHTPILVLSTEAEVKDRIRGLRTGADEFVGKPYDKNHLLALAMDLLRRRDSGAVPAAASVLVIDDSPTFREELRRALAAAGYQVLLAGSGEEGLRVAAGCRPAAILVDGVLPGIDGSTVVRRIRLDAALRRTPCLLLTGSQGAGAEIQALDAGADGFVRKEEDLSIVIARLASVLRGSPTADAGAPASLSAPKRILAVDDSPTYLDQTASVLREEGYDVVLATSGAEALELLGVQPVDCILLDVLMPGLSGQETCRRIKAVPVVRDIPLILLTALEDRDAMIEGLATGADDYIAKSSDWQVLKARVSAQIRRKQFEDETRRIRIELLQREIESAEARAARVIAESRVALVAELERKNRELEAFSYSVSHDLRTPLRSIDGFSKLLLDQHAAALDAEGRDYLSRVRFAAQRMGELIDDMLQLSRVGRAELVRGPVELSAVAREAVDELVQLSPERQVEVIIADTAVVSADPRLIRVALSNLLGNAWKFTARVDHPRIEFRSESVEDEVVFSVRDNGAGFSMQYAERLFQPFQRLHSEAQFPGTGIGLATVYRIIDRHGGRVWAEATPGGGATFSFTLPPPRPGKRR